MAARTPHRDHRGDCGRHQRCTGTTQQGHQESGLAGYRDAAHLLGHGPEQGTDDGGGEVLGAVGVSGGTGEQDQTVAEAGAAAFA
ncbi:heme-binding protein [Citricoccus parietis]|uniref:Heme-binding protein n=1 Tax=Citricoccus parietis TaxID=592307 RepID=A0ABV6F3Y6_9MICC